MKAVVSHSIVRFHHQTDLETRSDHIISEEPLELFLRSKSNPTRPFALSMRTPGNDKALCAGILFTSGVISKSGDILGIKSLKEDQDSTSVLVTIPDQLTYKAKVKYTNSSCGTCSYEAWKDANIESQFPVIDHSQDVRKSTFFNALKAIGENRDHFNLTGGNHKVSVLDYSGKHLFSAEDVSRHNAFDKVIGEALIAASLPLSNTIAYLSGRCSFEMTQKAWLAGIPILASLGAPTTKAISLAEEVGITLVGFLKNRSFNVYSNSHRIID